MRHRRGWLILILALVTALVYAGLLVIRAWHHSRGHTDRDVSLIPVSAHGTNPASAVTAGFKVVVVACDDKGNVDVEDLRRKAAAHRDEVVLRQGVKRKMKV